jgi:hypothetical protein
MCQDRINRLGKPELPPRQLRDFRALLFEPLVQKRADSRCHEWADHSRLWYGYCAPEYRAIRRALT